MVMPIHYLNSDFAVTGQISPADIPALAGAGFRTIVCARPDGESPAQPAFHLIAEAANAAGLEARHLPVAPGQVTPGHGETLAHLLAELPRRVLAYCGSGARASMMWRFAQAAGDR
jgi:sulfide:quinone oxidoreductase